MGESWGRVPKTSGHVSLSAHILPLTRRAENIWSNCRSSRSRKNFYASVSDSPRGSRITGRMRKDFDACEGGRGREEKNCGRAFELLGRALGRLVRRAVL